MRIIGYFFFTILISISIFFVLIITLEFTGISKFILKNYINKNILQIHKTKYYGKKLEKDPYQEVLIQHLHPYYFFGMSWKIKHIEEYNNSILNLNKNGFRKSLNFPNKENGIIVLGGSSAFGIGSSSYEKTISSIISSKTNFNAINRAYSGWNTHQELIAIAKYNEKYKYSLSITGINDFNNFCGTPKSISKNFPDLPSNFFILSDYFHDIRDKPIVTLNKKFKKFLIYNFPYTKKIYSFLKNKYINLKEIDNMNPNEFCGGKNQIDILVDQFIKNQNSIRNISNSIGAAHWIIIQPILSMHKNNNYKKEHRLEMLEYFVQKIINSEICEFNCLNLSNYFEQFTDKDYLFTIENNNFNEAYFLDESHVLDHAVEKMTNKIIKSVFIN